MAQQLTTSKKFGIYRYDERLENTFKLIEKEFSQETSDLIRQYANVMTSQSMAKATIHKHVQTLLNLSRFLGKEWKDVTKKDIEALVARIVQTYSENGQETNTTHDHKKILKIFFRWYKLGSRNKDEVGDPPETKDVKIKRVKDKIVREDLITEADKTKLLHACGENARDRAFIDCHLEAGTRPGEMSEYFLYQSRLFAQPRSISFSLVICFTQAGYSLLALITRIKFSLHRILSIEIPDLNCFNGDNNR